MRIFHRETSILAQRPWLDAEERDFKEPLRARMRRWGLGAIDASGLGYLRLLPRLAAMTVNHALSPSETLDVLAEELNYYGAKGLARFTDRLDIGSMLAAYRRGLLPACYFGSVKWRAPTLREAIGPDEFRIGGPTRRLLREERFRVTFDNDFCGVVEGCAKGDSYLSRKLMRALWKLHQAGYAHSVEVWDDNSKLAGGLYGIAIGEVFFAESRFTFVSKASGIAIAVLHHHLSHWGFALRTARWVDRNQPNSGRVVSRDVFQGLLRRYADRPGRVGRWKVEGSLNTYDWSVTLKGLRGAKTRLLPLKRASELTA